MQATDKKLARVSIIIFLLGYLLGMVILGLSVVGDFEAFMFKPTVDGKILLSTLKCPVMMASSETGTIAVTLSNPTESTISPYVKAHISAGFVTLIREERVNLFIEPYESQHLEWPIQADDAAYGGHWALVKILVSSQYPLPSSDASCGVFVTNLMGFTGTQVYTFFLIASVLFMGVGGGIINLKPSIRKADKNTARATLMMGIIGTLGLITTAIGSYLLLVSAIILVLGLLGFTTFFLYDKRNSV
jgi:hypothetical protein